MEGAALAAERKYDLLIAQSWHAARFSVLAQNNKLKALSSYLGKRATAKPNHLGKAVAFFQHLKSAGLPIEIKRTPRAPA